MNLLVYGNSGNGKTRLMGTAADDPRTSPMLLLDMEGGIASIRSKCRDIKLEEIGSARPKGCKQNIDVVRIRTYEEYMQALTADFDIYKSIGIDSLTEINYLVLQEVIQVGASMNSKHDAELAEIRDYGRCSTRMRKIIRELRDLPQHVILSCLSQEKPDPVTKMPKIMPSLVGKLVEELPGLMDAMGLLTLVDSATEEGKFERELLVAASDRWMGKIRGEGAIPESILQPTVSKLLDIVG